MKDPVLIKTYDAEGAINKYRIVTFGTNAKQVEQASANTDPLIGVNEAITVDDDERVDVIRSGFAEVEYGGTITKGDFLTSDQFGRAVKLTDAMLEVGASWSVGIAEESGASGDVGSVAIQPQKVSKSDTVNPNVGMPDTGVTAIEYGDGHHHTTALSVNTTLPAISGGAPLAVGKLLYTLPAGACVVNKAYMSLSITQTQGNINADTPDGGLGTTVASGAVAALDGTPAFENIITGQFFIDCSGTPVVKTIANQLLVIEASGNHTIYFNAADSWAAGGDNAALLDGTVVLEWDFMN
jgi:hypothetical protein